MREVRLYRKRFIPKECVELKDDEILTIDDTRIVTRWKCLKPREDFFSGLSYYFLKEGIKVSKLYKKDGSLRYWYCDIIKTEYDPKENIYIFTDLLADVIVMADGSVRVLDLDELAAADEQKLITGEELRMSLMQLHTLLQLIYKEQFTSIKAMIEEYEKE